MNLARKLNELQALDTRIHSFRQSLSELNARLNDTATIDKARADLEDLKKSQLEITQRHRDLDFQIEDLQNNISKFNEKLYGGKVGNPKELMSIEQEADILKKQKSTKEDELLELMNEEETTAKKLKMQSEYIQKIEAEKLESCKDLTRKRDEEEGQLAVIEKQRQQVVAGIDSQTLVLYESLKSKKGQAVVKVEQGRCQGCRISLFMNEMKRVRSGELVQCGSCGKIMFLE